MTFTIWFLAASCLGYDDKACCEPCKAPTCAKSDCTCAGQDNCGLFSRFFRKSECERCDKNCAWHGTLCARQDCTKPCAPCPCPCPVVAKRDDSRPTIVTISATAPASPAVEIKPEYLGRVGKAADYAWVTGQLFYIHADGGLWVVRYAPVDREDRYGGSVVLTAATHMGEYREGDLITVHGEIINEGRASKFLGGPLYRANSLEMVARTGN